MQTTKQALSDAIHAVLKAAAPLACACVAVTAYCQPPAQADSERQALISRVREGAINYVDQLQDFTCIQLTIRSAGRTGSNPHWKHLETQEQELSYVGHRERYKLLKIDGQPPADNQKIKGGYFTPGSEFASYFRKVFDPKAQAAFEWDHEDTSGGRRVCVFRYRVLRATSTWSVTANKDEIVMGHHGFVHADCETGAILRLQIETEISDGKPVGIQADVHYAMAKIAGKEFLLPRKVEEIVRFHSQLTKVDIEFRDYRKFSSESTITFK